MTTPTRCTVLLAILLCSATTALTAGSPSMDNVAEQYVKLVLALGQHDPDYVDAYHGPDAWQAEALSAKATLEQIHTRADVLLKNLDAMNDVRGEMPVLRHQYLSKQLRALRTRTEMLQGKKFLFDEESRLLYDAVAPVFPEEHFKTLIAKLEPLLPGEGTLLARYDRFRSNFVIPKDRLDTVFTAAIAECRKRTKEYIRLPPGESFTIEYVTDKPWSGYNWYKGNSHSLIQVNTDLPIYIERAIDLAAHEGYPGHHVYNVLLEEHLLKERGWIEFSVYPLFSPQSLVAEGSANYGIHMAFSNADRLTFSRNVLFPLAGLDPSQAERYYTVFDIASELSYAGNEAARGYLNGTMTREAAVQWLMDYALMARDRAEQRVRFMEKYRSYVINYNLGQDMVKEYIARRAGTSVTKRWEEFARLLSSPRLPSELVGGGK